ncbi:MAG TPA: molybdopterin cofactor-binding domain-containing protein, partial [Gaiella sp.]|nr:molybdopterin cofactor-binding domain-containing protein [Gaiella sp.]
RTVEALAANGRLDPLQDAFLAAGAVQCGFCTPGMLVAASDLLARNPHPDDDEIREALAGTFCRCSGYAKIVEAVRLASGRGTAPTAREHAGVGERARRVDGTDKATGAFTYAGDLRTGGMLYGVTVRSPHASASIRSLDVSRAAAAPGVRAVLTAAEVPGEPTYGLDLPDRPALAGDVVRFEGEPVALVAAETVEQARSAAELVAVEYEPLPAIADMEGALRPDAPRVHDDGNVLRHVHVESGDPDTADADVWVEGYYETPMQDQAALGLEAALALPTGDGGVEVRASSQWLHADRRQIGSCLGISEDKVRVVLAGVGGAFGSREDVHAQIHAALLARATGSPVKIAYGREESFHGHVHRHPSRTWIRYGATHDGRLVAADVRLLLDGGAYASSSSAVVANAATFAAGPYEVPNVRVEATVVYTNNPPCGAMRGFGAPQVCFAHESALDLLAERLGIDPVELRLRNAVGPGSVLPTGQVLTGSAPVREVIERCAALPLPAEPPRAGMRRGVGFALGFKNVAFSEGFDDPAEATVTLRRGPDGLPEAEVRTAAVDAGHGLATVLAQIVRTELGVDRVRVVHADTATSGSAGSSSASRQTTMAGGAVVAACRAIRGELGAGDAERVFDQHEPPTVTRTATYRHRPTTGFDEAGQGDVHVSFSFVAERAVVDVDPELGTARVVEVAAVQDAGRVVDPHGAEGQVEGGVAMGLGLALTEELLLDHGHVRNPRFAEYLIPTALDVPPVVTEFVEVPEPGAPYGVKGIGEHATIAATPAIVAALRAATGHPLNRVPVAPEDLLGLRPPAATRGRAPRPHDDPDPRHAPGRKELEKAR